MSTSWKSQQSNGKYSLQFETYDKEKYKLVERAAQMAVDLETRPEVETFKIGDVVASNNTPHLIGEVIYLPRGGGRSDGIALVRVSDGTREGKTLLIAIKHWHKIEEGER